MKVGDKAKILDEAGTVTVKKITGSMAVVEDEYGFELSYPLSQLLPCVPQTLEIENTESKKNDVERNKPVPPKPRLQVEVIREIDLHIGHLVDSMKGLRPHQMLEKQLITAKDEIERARKDRVKKLILIHGKGKGILKSEIYCLLNRTERIEFFEADIIKYRFGAVEIRFK
ncbi:MAG: hypothetical protein LBT29_04920 [Flavobacteriaceae bacterium]|jgi:dsDNA-specific endonuclease/ATPase MutS2|nr:hypothetical protein [Flavobacteriaceae bacterium]